MHVKISAVAANYIIIINQTGLKRSNLLYIVIGSVLLFLPEEKARVSGSKAAHLERGTTFYFHLYKSLY